MICKRCIREGEINLEKVAQWPRAQRCITPRCGFGNNKQNVRYLGFFGNSSALIND